MARRLEYTTYRPDDVTEPIEMKINDRAFYFKPTMPGTEMLGYLANIDDEHQAKSAQTIRALFQNTLVDDPSQFPKFEIPEDNIAAFFAYCDDRDNHVDLAKIQEMANDLLGEMAGGPYRVVAEVCRWLRDEWIWAYGKALREGCDLRKLNVEQLVAVTVSLWEDFLIDPEKESRRSVRNTFSAYPTVIEQLQAEGRPPVVTDPEANPFPDVPLPAGFREQPLPPVSRKSG